MNGFTRLIRKYVMVAAVITCSFLILNLLVYFYFMVNTTSKGPENFSMKKIARELTITGSSEEENLKIELSQTGEELLKKNYEWAMFLDQNGTVVWEEQMPKELPRSYRMTEIAAFSKWYLKDYPIYEWTTDQGLFITAMPKDTTWRLSVNIPIDLVRSFPRTFLIIAALNLSLICLICILVGYRFYRSLAPIAEGIDQMAKQEVTELKEKGTTKELALKINETSRVLQKQKSALNKRDMARTNWIAGVSHDIRTPLAMIMGYADRLEEDKELTEEQQKQAQIIKNQSVVIKNLIEQLNLTSKLEYHMQPLQIQEFSIAAMLREVVADYYNNGLDELFEIELDLENELESIQFRGDKQLFRRIFTNLIGNSIRHNESGCLVYVSGKIVGETILLKVADDGKGIAQNVLEVLAEEESSPDQKVNQPHVMGLRIAKQIVRAHGGRFKARNVLPHGCEITIELEKSDRKG